MENPDTPKTGVPDAPDKEKMEQVSSGMKTAVDRY
jgi:hypothetical protein